LTVSTECISRLLLVDAADAAAANAHAIAGADAAKGLAARQAVAKAFTRRFRAGSELLAAARQAAERAVDLGQHLVALPNPDQLARHGRQQILVQQALLFGRLRINQRVRHPAGPSQMAAVRLPKQGRADHFQPRFIVIRQLHGILLY
jgi:hypothetical protein